VTVHQLFIDIKKVKTEIILYNIPIEFTVPMKLLRLIKMCIFETYTKVFVGKRFSDVSYLEWFRKGRCLIAIVFQFCFRIFYIRKVQEKHAGLKLNWAHQLLFCADDVNLL
jgi:hypothetical protein